MYTASLPLWLMALLGIVEGITEFLPVSSSGHLLLCQSLFPYSFPRQRLFEITLQLGAHVATIWYFWKPGLRLLGLSAPATHREAPNDFGFSLLHIFIALLPVVCIGGFFHNAIALHLSARKVVPFGLNLGSMVLLWAVWVRSRSKRSLKEQFSIKDAFCIGWWQVLAFCPGVSRSAVTISGAILCGIAQRSAVQFSFILAIPLMIAASVRALAADHAADWQAQELIGFAVGILSAAGTGRLLIAPALDVLATTNFRLFILYRFLLALLLSYLFY